MASDTESDAGAGSDSPTEAAPDTCEAWVVQTVGESTAAEIDGVQTASSNLWTSERRLRSEGEKPSVPWSGDEILDGIDTALGNRSIIGWHGLLAPATEAHLRSIVANENQSTEKRNVLIEKARAMIQHVETGDQPDVESEETDG